MLSRPKNRHLALPSTARGGRQEPFWKNDGSLDSHAFNAAATLGLLGLNPFSTRSIGGDPAAGGEVGRVVGMASPCDDMQLRNASKAVAKPPPNPWPKPPDGRSDAQASAACWNAALPLPKPAPPNPPGLGAALGGALGTLTPCSRRQLR
jgi:hypothetical protein